jgi:tight adherence protein B
MQFVLAALTFTLVVVILVGAFALGGQGGPEKVVRRRLESIEKGVRRGHDSVNLKLIREELLSDVPAVHRLLLHWSWAVRLRDYINQAGLDWKPGRLILVSALMALGGYLVVLRLYANPIIPALAAVAAAVVPISFVAIKRSRRMRAFERTFPEAIDLLGRAVRAGHSFSTGLEMIATELPEPVSGEFRTAFDEQNFGLPLRDALLNLAERVPIIDVQFFVTALLVQKETGGNLAEILDKLAHVVRDRFRILGEVRVRTAQGRLTASILMALPPLMTVIMRALNPSYINTLFTDPWGPYMLGGAAVLQVIGSLLLWKIVNIEV